MRLHVCTVCGEEFESIPLLKEHQEQECEGPSVEEVEADPTPFWAVPEVK